MTLADLREHLSGQGRRRYKAIIRWAQLLTKHPNYYDQILGIARLRRPRRDADHPLGNQHPMMCLAGYLIAPPRR
ncbi:hypothetical protein [Rhodococcus erythropolis]|uniref:hypothetical protein n=1 Tax=Rhodococcus erythropolis TaxID=1833 RepID=UPI000A9482D4|nr:hypothetical protein [Rhodococcus erythropolis]